MESGDFGIWIPLFLSAHSTSGSEESIFPSASLWPLHKSQRAPPATNSHHFSSIFHICRGIFTPPMSPISRKFNKVASRRNIIIFSLRLYELALEFEDVFEIDRKLFCSRSTLTAKSAHCRFQIFVINLVFAKIVEIHRYITPQYQYFSQIVIYRKHVSVSEAKSTTHPH